MKHDRTLIEAYKTMLEIDREVILDRSGKLFWSGNLHVGQLLTILLLFWGNLDLNKHKFGRLVPIDPHHTKALK